MKKACLMVGAVLLALLMAGCNNFVAPKNEGPSGSGGRVKIVIEDDNNSRSLLTSVAKSDTDYVEVIFLKGAVANVTPVIPWVEGSAAGEVAEIHREAWLINNIGTIGIPDNFDLANDECVAVAFAGLKEGKVLLAVGEVSRIGGSAAVGLNTKIKNGQTVAFRMCALTSSISGDPGLTTFKITDTGSAAIETTAALNGASKLIPTLEFKDKDIPVFRIANKTEAAGNTIRAEYGFEFKYVEAPFAILFDPYSYVINDGEPAIRAMGTNLGTGYAKAMVGVDITNPFGTPVPLPSTLNLEIEPDDSGLCTIFFRIPVYMGGLREHDPIYGSDPIPHTKWYLQSGLDNSLLDDGSLLRAGAAANGTGGAILLGVGEDYDYKEKEGLEIEIDLK